MLVQPSHCVRTANDPGPPGRERSGAGGGLDELDQLGVLIGISTSATTPCSAVTVSS